VVRLSKVELALQVENSFVLLIVQKKFVSSMWVHDASFINVRRTYYHTEQLMQWPDLMLKVLAR